MKTGFAILAVAVLSAAGLTSAQAQTAQPAAGAQAAPAPAREDWNAFSRSSSRVYLTNVGSIATVGDVTSIQIALVPLRGAAGDLSHSRENVEFKCAAKQSRTVSTTEYGPDGVQTDNYDDSAAEWDAYSSTSRDAYLSAIACDGQRAAPPTWQSIKAYVDAGRK